MFLEMLRNFDVVKKLLDLWNCAEIREASWISTKTRTEKSDDHFLYGFIYWFLQLSISSARVRTDQRISNSNQLKQTGSKGSPFAAGFRVCWQAHCYIFEATLLLEFLACLSPFSIQPCWRARRRARVGEKNAFLAFLHEICFQSILH